MKPVLLILLASLLTSCGKPESSYQDSHITIVGRVELLDSAAAEDGGTQYLRIRDESGTVHDLYISNRIGHEAEWGTVFANAYMDKPGSVKLENQAEIKKLLADFINSGLP